jgi:hypothetical protein
MRKITVNNEVILTTKEVRNAIWAELRAARGKIAEAYRILLQHEANHDLAVERHEKLQQLHDLWREVNHACDDFSDE